MTFVRPPYNRWWFALAAIAGMVWAFADSSTRWTMGGVRSTMASEITGDPSDQAQIPGESRLEAIGPRMVLAALPDCSGPDGVLFGRHSRPKAIPASNTNHPVEHRPLLPASEHRDGSGSPARVAGSRRRTMPGSHKRIVVCSATGVAGDPNDDGTSGDPDEDDDNETSKFLDSDDNTDVACPVWLQEMVPYLILADHCASTTWPALPPSHFPMLQQLRC